MKKTLEAPSSERGAVLVHVALALIALMSFSTFVVDYGVFWTARRQAQNAADAGALAGAVALAFDNPTDFSNFGPAYTSANQVAMSHPVWGQQPAVNIEFLDCPGDVTVKCIKVDVYRNTGHGNALPMIFGQLVGLNTQNVRAMAMAKVAIANSTNCLKPWGVIDKWAEHHPIDPGTWDVTSIYDKYDDKGNVDPAVKVPDVYVAPTVSSPGTGFHPFNPDKSLTSDYGLQIRLTVGDKTDFHYATGWFAPLALQDSRGGKDYLENIKGCVGATYSIGQTIQVESEPGKKVGPTEQAVEKDVDSIIRRDKNAVWDPTLNGGHGGVANSAFNVSPRIVPVPLIDPEVMAAFKKGGRTDVVISNIMGFFVEDYDKSAKEVIGRLVTTAGLLQVGSTSPIGGQSSFLQAIILVR